MDDVKKHLAEKEKAVDDLKRDKEILAMEKNNLDDQLANMLRKLKRIEKENADMKDSYPLVISIST